jgi:Cu(I)/Ag(I) efflux system membrane fusion protein
MRQLAESSLQRLKNWDISDEQLRALAKSGDAKRTLTFRSPVAGVVTDKKAVQGMRFLPGETLFQIADTSAVWVLADVFEQDIGAVHAGQKADIRINAYPGEVFAGRIAYVYPTLKAETRTVPVRIELPNPKGKLKPAMFADVDIPAGGGQPVLTVPASAVIDSSARQTVVVQLAEGRFEPRVGQARPARRGVCAGARRRARGRNGRFVRQLPDRRRKQSQGGAGGNAEDRCARRETGGGGAQGDRRGERDRRCGGQPSPSRTSRSPACNWPAMKMDFVLANPGLVAGLQPGTAVAFEFVERGPGEWVITSLVKK